MTVAELIAILQTMPQDYNVEINDNQGGNAFPRENVNFFPIYTVDCFGPEDMDPDFPDSIPSVVIQVNVE